MEVAGLELHGHHGVEEEERERGQRFLFDVELEVRDERPAETDRIEDALDYREVVAIVREVSDGRAYRLLEALAAAVADALLARLAAGRVRVRVRKPDVRLGVAVEHSAVTVERVGRECEARPRASARIGAGGPRSTVRPVARAYVGLGANLGDRETTMRRALELLAADPEIEVVAVSAFRETAPVGIVDQPRFLNAAAAVETELGPRQLLERLLAVELALGRTRGARWGPRTIDLDLLVHGDAVVDEAGLTVPHPRLHERRFVLEPLAELAPDLLIPGHGSLRRLLEQLPA